MTEPVRIIGDRFALYELVGQGAMGDVWLGMDLRTEEQVAVKALKSNVIADDPSVLERFAREGEALARLNHPNIVKMLAAVEEDQQRYLIMEYVDGGSLRDLLEARGPLPMREVLEICLDLSDALARAHRLQVIHRDIKPANVLIASDGTPRLSDFGIAKMSDRTAMTETGSLMGTYAYISPEQCMGEPPDPRSDIWAFGVMMYEMLTGTRPFQENNPVALLRAIIADPVPPITNHRDDLPLPLVVLINAMLQKDREDRVSSVRLVGSQIEVILSGGTQYPLQANGVDVIVDNNLAAEGAASSERLSEAQQYLRKTPTAASVPPQTGNQQDRRQRGRLTAVITVIVLAAVLATGAFFALRETPPVVVDVNITPVDADEFMVLVAEFETLRGAEPQQVQRFVVEDLRTHFEQSVPFSNIRIREYPATIQSPEQASQIAENVGAAVVIWGSYDDIDIRAQLQSGNPVVFDQIRVDPAFVSEVANLSLVLNDPRRESLAAGVASVLNATFTALDDPFGVVNTIAILDVLAVNNATTTGNSPSANWYRYASNFLTDEEAALSAINEAVELNPGNPLLTAARAVILQRLGRWDEAQRDVETSARLGPENWVMPMFVEGNEIIFVQQDIEAAVTLYDEILEIQPDNWLFLTMRGGLHNLQGNHDAAYADFQSAIEDDPQANFPYVFAVSQALRRGEITLAQEYAHIVLDEFPDPDYVERITEAAYGNTLDNIFAAPISAFVNLRRGQYEAALENVQTGLAFEPYQEVADLYLLQGLAQCNLGNDEAAERAYSRAIDRDPEFGILYLLRAEVRANPGATRQGGTRPEPLETVGALADLRRARDFDLGTEYNQLLLQGAAGNVGCQNFFDVSLTSTPPNPPPLEEISPSTDNELTVLVANITQLPGAQPRPIQQWIVEDLQRNFEDAVSFSPIRIRAHPEPFASEAQAQDIAENEAAAVIIWGDYDDEGVRLRVEVGSLIPFPNNSLPRAQLEQLSNVVVELNDPRRESLTSRVGAVFNVLHTANEDPYRLAEMYVLIDTAAVASADPIGNGVGARWHRVVENFLNDPEQALIEADAAMTLESTNPILYLGRSLVLQRLGRFEDARPDIETAIRLGPDDWSTPYISLTVDALYFEDNEALAIEHLNELIERQPNEWFSLTFRGIAYILEGEIDLAREDLSTAINSDPAANLPYVFATLIALREGRLDEARMLVQEVLDRFPDPSAGQRIIAATFGNEIKTSRVDVVSAFGNLTLGQYERVLQDIDNALNDDDLVDLPDLYTIRGFAHCNLGNYDEAITAYTDAIERNPDAPMPYILRAEVYRKNGNRGRSLSDLNTARQLGLNTELREMVLSEGNLDCESFFSTS